MRAIGYHGTSDAAARRILSSGFEISRNDYDWLGDGAYFFQDAPLRALEWARQRFGADGAVIGAEIDLRDCVDFLDVSWERAIEDVYGRFVQQLNRVGLRVPRQTSGAHRLDRAVINYLAAEMHTRGIVYRSVRAAFAEGEPLYPGSALLRRAHVQIAVRELDMVTRVWREEGRSNGT